MVKKVCPAPWAELDPPRKLVFEEEEYSVTSEGEKRAHKKEEPAVCLEITDPHKEEVKTWSTTFLGPAMVV